MVDVESRNLKGSLLDPASAPAVEIHHFEVSQDLQPIPALWRKESAIHAPSKREHSFDRADPRTPGLTKSHPLPALRHYETTHQDFRDRLSLPKPPPSENQQQPHPPRVAQAFQRQLLPRD